MLDSDSIALIAKKITTATRRPPLPIITADSPLRQSPDSQPAGRQSGKSKQSYRSLVMVFKQRWCRCFWQ